MNQTPKTASFPLEIVEIGQELGIILPDAMSAKLNLHGNNHVNAYFDDEGLILQSHLSNQA